MRRFLKWLGIAVTCVAVLLGTAVFWLFYDNRRPDAGVFDLNLNRIRASAKALTGPERIAVEVLSHTFVPKIGIVAGTDWRAFDMARVSFQLVYPDRTIIVDTGYPIDVARQAGAASYDMDAWRRMQRALLEASDIVVTHEHADHIGGLMASRNLPSLMTRARLTPEQTEASIRTSPLHWPSALIANYRPLRFRDLYPLAPGVVLVRAPGHTPGSQMVYVRRSDGREFLFMGDVASAADNILLEKIRPLHDHLLRQCARRSAGRHAPDDGASPSPPAAPRNYLGSRA